MLHSLFHPKSVAIIGASTKDLSIGNVITKNLLHYKFNGAIYPINPSAPEVRGVKAYPSVLDCPGDVDLVHISIPSKFVPAAIDECGRKGVKNIIINSAGFKEIGPIGIALEKESIEIAKKYGMRIFGPNCQGIINTHPDYKAYCDFTFTYPKPGNISIVAQSGGVGAVLMQRFYDLDIGLRFYASNGNACDVSIPEIIEYYGNDEETKVIVLYVEAFANPLEFLETARKVTAKKPILAMRSGRTEQGAKASMSHTGGLAGAGLSTELIFKKTGIVTFRDEEEMCQAAIAFSLQPIPKSNRVGIITDTGGPAIIATDSLVEGGLEMPDLSGNAKLFLKDKLYAEASIANPIDVLATAAAVHWRAAMDALMDDEQIDSIYINFVTPPFVDCEAVAREMAEISNMRKKPVICNYMTDKEPWTATTAILKSGNIPCYDFPEMAAKALSSLVGYRNILNRKIEEPRIFPDTDKDIVVAIIENCYNENRLILNSGEVYSILRAYGINTVPCALLSNIDDVVSASESIGYPLVLKADSPKIIHKSDTGGVILNLKNSDELRKAAVEMARKYDAHDLKFFIQKYIPGGKEIIIGAAAEPGLGHIIMFGLGGVLVELLKDVSFCLTPVSRPEALEMTETIKTAQILKGYRGDKGVDIPKLIETIQRISRLVTENPQIAEMDLNPVTAFENDVFVLDARIKLQNK
ncbi:MAG: acetate--CoA ligase family protein [Candidatus Kapabacteria bacterium]|nr:acetate--CoA ligase family protein [Candidatus Kapabacteria bacterium]